MAELDWLELQSSQNVRIQKHRFFLNVRVTGISAHVHELRQSSENAQYVLLQSATHDWLCLHTANIYAGHMRHLE